ncbi:MBL fold metallo-hydrolase [Flavihumibacter sp. CACIAM 22H1]|uniref:MBL fold metallo-hydrolase n=1 Tax=Flavihumibacter sp. CACIAM 22H1 TaxID=1812911 RepID=UPI0007A8EBF8|nr:MBL fold metallo-hydrolase [Flavihumibacter sp. CACIAM 22H1]KYP14172.1 MAG: MBL fold metallo-hydrolase [Flavihumibacter sp. CACIAM 22H1]
MRVIPLSEGSFTIDGTKQFVPFSREADALNDRPAGSLLVEIQPFVVITSEDVLLLDTGLGFEVGGQSQLLKNLMEAGINPGEITKVLMTHLHKDHAGGVSHTNPQTGKFELSFPQADYYIQRRELDYAFEKGLPSYIPEELECLRTAPQVQLLEGDGVIAGYIEYQLVGGHCPYHQVFRIVDGGSTVFFGGDNAPQLQQMKSKFVAKYDYDGKLAMELRQEWWKKGQENNWKFLFYHDVKTPAYGG